MMYYETDRKSFVSNLIYKKGDFYDVWMRWKQRLLVDYHSDRAVCMLRLWWLW